MAGKAKRAEAVAYIRTSSAANVGADKDSDKRQRAAIEGFAKRAGFDLVGEFSARQIAYQSARRIGEEQSARVGFSPTQEINNPRRTVARDL
jgi:hypothetical protein